MELFEIEDEFGFDFDDFLAKMVRTFKEKKQTSKEFVVVGVFNNIVLRCESLKTTVEEIEKSYLQDKEILELLYLKKRGYHAEMENLWSKLEASSTKWIEVETGFMMNIDGFTKKIVRIFSENTIYHKNLLVFGVFKGIVIKCQSSKTTAAELHEIFLQDYDLVRGPQKILEEGLGEIDDLETEYKKKSDHLVLQLENLDFSNMEEVMSWCGEMQNLKLLYPSFFSKDLSLNWKRRMREYWFEELNLVAIN